MDLAGYLGVQVLRRQKRREGTSLSESAMIESFAVPWAPPAFYSLAEMLPPIRYLTFLLSASQPTAILAETLSRAEKVGQPYAGPEIYSLQRTLQAESYL